MPTNSAKLVVLVDDNENDRELASEALRQSDSTLRMELLVDGVEALDFLHCRGRFTARPPELPAVILLDMKMPRVGGLEVLRDIKGDPRLKMIPVIMMTTSVEHSDIKNSYEIGANAYVRKPLDFEEFTKVMQAIETFWIEHNEPPASKPPLS